MNTAFFLSTFLLGIFFTAPKSPHQKCEKFRDKKIKELFFVLLNYCCQKLEKWQEDNLRNTNKQNEKHTYTITDFRVLRNRQKIGNVVTWRCNIRIERPRNDPNSKDRLLWLSGLRVMNRSSHKNYRTRK